MSLIINEFKVFHSIPANIKQNVEYFHVFESNFGICVTNDDKVYAFGENNIKQYFGYEVKNISNNYILIRELCYQNIQQFFCFNYLIDSWLFARSNDNKIYGSGKNGFGQLARGYRSKLNDTLKAKRIEFFDNKNIIDIKCGLRHCLALTSEGLVYGWGHNCRHRFRSSTNSSQLSDFDYQSDYELEDINENDLFLTPVLINSEFGVEKPIKHIHCYYETSVLVSFDGFVYILNKNELNLKYKLSELSDVYKIYLDYNTIVLRNNGYLEYISVEEEKTFDIKFEYLVDSHYYSNELIIETNEGIQTINIKNGNLSQLNHKNAFEYCLFKYKKTFTTIHLRENGFYYKSFELNGKTNTLFESIKRIDFNVKEFNEKFYSEENSKSLKNFRITNTLPEILDSKVKVYHQIGKYDSQKYAAIFVMNDNKVYAIGYNNKGILGLGHNRSLNEYTLIEELCDQNIEEFFEGKGFIFGRNNENKIFNWGNNDEGQLTRGDVSNCLKPMKIDFFENKNVIEISCGFRHCLGLTSEGVLYGWGYNRCGQTGSRSDNRVELTPIRVELSYSSDNRIKFIHCCDDTSCAVTVDGRAFIWGKVFGKETVIPKLIETNVSKMYLNSDSKFSILTMNGIFNLYNENKIFWLKFRKSSLKTGKVYDILGHNTLLKEDAVYEVNEYNNKIQKTTFSNFYEYFLSEKKEIKETIHITSDGYLMRPNIELNLNSNENLFKKKFVNIFERKFENSFEIIEKIEEGGFGVVFKVENKSTKVLFAIKRLRIKNDFKEFMKEIQIMSQMESEFVVKYYNSWTEAKAIYNEIITFIYIQMELCSQNLKSIIELFNDLDEEKFKSIKYFIRSELLVEIIECLNYLHSMNIIHNGLNPRNILITEGMNKRIVKLCDFGLSKVNESQNTRSIGTLQYIAPEVRDYDDYDLITGKSHYSLKADIYSMGVVAKQLFEFKDSIKTIRKLEVFDKYLSEYPKTEIKIKFKNVFKEISLMLSKKPEERLSCSELLDKTHEWTVDTNTVRSDENYKEFLQFSENDENLKILKRLLTTKLSIK